jgi:hypothetical protein
MDVDCLLHDNAVVCVWWQRTWLRVHLCQWPENGGSALFISWVISGTGMMLGMSFLVTLQWRLLIVCNACLAVCFLVFIIIGKFVRPGMVMIGVSSITVCSYSCMRNRVSSTTLCSSWAGRRCNKSCIFWLDDCSNLFPLGVPLTIAVASANLSISALRC